MANFAIAAQAQNINSIAKFESDLHNLLGLLGKSDVTVLAPGNAYKIYKSSGDLSAQTVQPGAEIPNSGITMGDPTLVEITFGKYRNLVPIEKIAEQGYNVAVGGSNTAMVKKAQAKARKSIIDGLAEGTGTVAVASTATFQQRIASAAAYVQEHFEDDAVTPVFFANTTDVYGYLGDTGAGLAQNFGLSYLENFMGIGNVIVDSNVPAGTVYGTACENLEVVAADVRGIEGMDLATDESGIIAVHNSPAYANGALETVVYTGLAVMPVFADRIAVVAESE